MVSGGKDMGIERANGGERDFENGCFESVRWGYVISFFLGEGMI